MENLEFLTWNDLYRGSFVGDDREPEKILDLPHRTIMIRGRVQDSTEISVKLDGVQYYQGPATQSGPETLRGFELARFDIPVMINGTVRVDMHIRQGQLTWVGTDANYAGNRYKIIVSPTAVWGRRSRRPASPGYDIESLAIPTDDVSVLQDRKRLSQPEFDRQYGDGSYTHNFLYAVTVGTEENFAPIVCDEPPRDPRQNLTVDGESFGESDTVGELHLTLLAGQTVSCQIIIPEPVLCWPWYNHPKFDD
jgi:hypothetical protein